MSVISLKPSGERGGAFGGVSISANVGPFTQGGFDQTFRFAVGLGRIGLGEEIFDAQPGTGFAEGGGAVATAACRS